MEISAHSAFSDQLASLLATGPFTGRVSEQPNILIPEVRTAHVPWICTGRAGGGEGGGNQRLMLA